ncbi:MAG: R3H domain-containing nucleic acid-binding protein [Erysipelotrichaceae bacterium]
MKSYTGKNLDELLQNAAKEKQVSVEELTYTVTEEKKGFLGLGGEVTASVYCVNDICEFIADYLELYFKDIELEIDIDVSVENNFFYVDLNAENNAILIGRNGQTLQALNTVTKAAVSSEFKRRVGILIDVNGYKEEKYAKVCALAKRVAKSVQRSKTDALLDPMPADERKAIHNALTNVRFISTASEGEGRDRRIKILYDPSKSEIDE